MQKSKYTFEAIFTKEKEGGYSVRFPQLDGCYTQGDTLEAAQRNAVDAMSLHLYGMEQEGETIPDAVLEPVEDLKAWESVVLVTAWMTPFREAMQNQAIKKTLTIPAWLNAEAERRNVNFSQVLQSALKDYLRIYHP